MKLHSYQDLGHREKDIIALVQGHLSKHVWVLEQLMSVEYDNIRDLIEVQHTNVVYLSVFV